MKTNREIANKILEVMKRLRAYARKLGGRHILDMDEASGPLLGDVNLCFGCWLHGMYKPEITNTHFLSGADIFVDDLGFASITRLEDYLDENCVWPLSGTASGIFCTENAYSNGGRLSLLTSIRCWEKCARNIIKREDSLHHTAELENAF